MILNGKSSQTRVGFDLVYYIRCHVFVHLLHPLGTLGPRAVLGFDNTWSEATTWCFSTPPASSCHTSASRIVPFWSTMGTGWAGGQSALQHFCQNGIPDNAHGRCRTVLYGCSTSALSKCRIFLSPCRSGAQCTRRWGESANSWSASLNNGLALEDDLVLLTEDDKLWIIKESTWMFESLAHTVKSILSSSSHDDLWKPF